MSYLLKTLASKEEVDEAIRSTEDVVVVLRFGKESDLTCMQLDEIVSCVLAFWTVTGQLADKPNSRSVMSQTGQLAD